MPTGWWPPASPTRLCFPGLGVPRFPSNKRGLGTERARPGTFRGFGTELIRIGTFRRFGTDRARLGTFNQNVKIFTQSEHLPAQSFFFFKGPIIKRSVPNSLKVPSLARSVPKPLKCLVLHVLCLSL